MVQIRGAEPLKITTLLHSPREGFFLWEAPVPYFVYILLNPDGKTYVGHTNDIDRRLKEHNDPDYSGTLHTKRHRLPWSLVHKEEFHTRSEAMKRERELKTGKGREWIKANFRNHGC